MFPQCKFSREFLHPRYWLTWFGLGVLWLWVQLPYPVLCFLGTRIGAMARPFLKRRESIARKNLELCFPQHSAEEREKMIAENFRSLGMALVETGMAWFWPDSRVRKWFDVEGLDNLKRAQMQNRGVMVVGVHFMSLELGGRVMGLCQPMMATYRPHNNQLMEWVQTRGRMRSNKAMIGRNNLRGIVGALKKGEAVWFAPDQDYGRKGSSFAPFFRGGKCRHNQWHLCSLPSLWRSDVDRNDGKKSGLQRISPVHYRGRWKSTRQDENQAAAHMNKIIRRDHARTGAVPPNPPSL